MHRTAVFGDVRIGKEPWHADRYNSVTVVFGNCRIDFRQAEMEEVTKLRIVSVFGDTRVIIQEGLSVNLEGVSVFGDRRVKRSGEQPSPDAAKVLNIYATTVFGDLQIRDEP